jgi:biotin synthase-related radical SAM superfamily protein
MLPSNISGSENGSSLNSRIFRIHPLPPVPNKTAFLPLHHSWCKRPYEGCHNYYREKKDDEEYICNEVRWKILKHYQIHTSVVLGMKRNIVQRAPITFSGMD